ncbi:AraC family transcriptional regulator [Parahaliea maris]|uniref:AraC family transcriptional regulator n=1 Tax=Parahaliea maris TaxID=2716870 RepID=A0A5C9A776_9GAMM|nr:AraC family transcriptional regulator [Parahaliea maris]TXS95862.1 AraC family transcriptional regulator [Parahaliea maris]
MTPHDFSNEVPGSFAIPLLEDLDTLGSDLDQLWQRAAVTAPRQSVMTGRTAALPAAEFTRLYRCCMEELERLSCLDQGIRPMGRGAVNMLCYAVLPCRTLREIIGRVIEFNDAMEDRGGEISLEESGDTAVFSMQVPRKRYDNPALLVDITGLYFYFQLFSWMVSRRLPLSEVGVVYGKPGKHYPLMELFERPVSFGAVANRLAFPGDCLDLPSTRSLTELERIIDHFPFDLSAGAASGRASPSQIRLLILDAIQSRREVPALETAAQLFHTSPATLRRRLREGGTSYSEIRAQCQREIAERLLSNRELSIESIAEHVGFGSDRAFRRGFHSWTGLSPSEFREGLASKR